MTKDRTAARPVYHHPRWGGIASLTDPAIDFFALTGRASPDGADLEGRLERFLKHTYWPWLESGASKLDPAWLQSGNASPVSGYDVRANMRHKGEHATGPGRAAAPELADPAILHYEQVVDMLLTTGDLTDRHLWMLEQVWRRGRPLERPDEDRPLPKLAGVPRRANAALSEEQVATLRLTDPAGKPLRSARSLAREWGVDLRTILDARRGVTYRVADPEQTVAAQLQISNAAVKEMWARVTVTLYFSLFDV